MRASAGLNYYLIFESLFFRILENVNFALKINSSSVSLLSGSPSSLLRSLITSSFVANSEILRLNSEAFVLERCTSGDVVSSLVMTSAIKLDDGKRLSDFLIEMGIAIRAMDISNNQVRFYDY